MIIKDQEVTKMEKDLIIILIKRLVTILPITDLNFKILKRLRERNINIIKISGRK